MISELRGEQEKQEVDILVCDLAQADRDCSRSIQQRHLPELVTHTQMLSDPSSQDP